MLKMIIRAYKKIIFLRVGPFTNLVDNIKIYKRFLSLLKF